MIQVVLRETLKPNVSGYSANKRLRRVDFPEPEGPAMTKILEAVCMVMMSNEGEREGGKKYLVGVVHKNVDHWILAPLDFHVECFAQPYLSFHVTRYLQYLTMTFIYTMGLYLCIKSLDL